MPHTLCGYKTVATWQKEEQITWHIYLFLHAAKNCQRGSIQVLTREGNIDNSNCHRHHILDRDVNMTAI